MFLTLSKEQEKDIYAESSRQKNQFIKNGHLDMKLILEKFVIYFDEIYGDQEQKFLEEDGRRKKLWRGDSYNTRGEKQLFDYLDYYHLEKGYMLSFNFSQQPRSKLTGHQTCNAAELRGIDPCGSRQMCMQACPLGSLPAGIKRLAGIDQEKIFP